MNKLIVALAAVPGVALAGPLDTDRVSADAKWLMHVDCEAFKASALGGWFLEHAEELDIGLEELDEIEREIGLDPRRDLMSVTAYGTGDDSEEGGVIIAVTTEQADEALERLREHEDVDVREVNVGRYSAYVIEADGEKCYVDLQRSGRGKRIVVISEDKDAFVDALDVIADRAPSLSRARSWLVGEGPGRDSILFLAARDIDEFPDIDPASQILRLCEGFTIDVGETDGILAARAGVTAGDAETAQSIAQVVRGMVALGHLAARKEPELMPLVGIAQALDVSVRDDHISLGVALPVKQLLEELEAAMELHDDDDDDDDDNDDHDPDDHDDDDDDDDWRRDPI